MKDNVDLESLKRAQIDAAWAELEGRSAHYSMSPANFHALWESQDKLCYYCERETWFNNGSEEAKRRRNVDKSLMATREHLIRRADGGDDSPSNIVSSCHECNSKRQDDPVSYHKLRMLLIYGQVSRCLTAAKTRRRR